LRRNRRKKKAFPGYRVDEMCRCRLAGNRNEEGGGERRGSEYIESAQAGILTQQHHSRPLNKFLDSARQIITTNFTRTGDKACSWPLIVHA